MAKIIEVNKYTDRSNLDIELNKLGKKRKPIDVKKYFGSVNFGVDGLEYQLKSRNEWQ